MLEAFMRHDVAPMAGRIADREEDRFVSVARLGERRVAPGAPMHGIVAVLLQIGAGLASQLITAHPFPAGITPPHSTVKSLLADCKREYIWKPQLSQRNRVEGKRAP